MTKPPRAGPIAPRTITNPILKEATIFLEISRESGGCHTLVDVLLSPGAGNPMHYHDDFSEEFTCLEGELSIQFEKQVIRLQPGESVLAPAQSKHRFFNQSGTFCRFQCRFTPGFPGFEQALQISYGLARDGKTTARGMPKNPYAIGYLVLISRTYLTGGIALFQPLLTWLGRRAIKNGVAAELQRRYLTVW
ncbi:cupin domain-containing protein [Larkinella terrae]|uniref:Cupin domain-containing protein n=1 Tax=Larkinella terrae TaxID=2025311 RepID=A0A7K0EFL8_9BACT|nr:cupin domain-containing protein [Larkinella terrae]MRS60238.1 cupin domain-containing protein [Larkinella terrae]